MALTQVQGGMLAGSTNTTTTIQSNGTTAITIDSSQNVGIGTSSPATRLDVRCVSDVTQDIAYFSRPDAAVRAKIALDGSGIINFGTSTNHPLAFLTNNAERMRITSAGRVVVNKTTSDMGCQMEVKGINSFGAEVTTVTGTGLQVTYTPSSGLVYWANFTYNGSNMGSITSSGSTTAYNTSSDYRLKENIAPMTGALATVAQLKPVTYDWKAGGSSQGFIAHELQAVVPDCVTGEKDAVETYTDKDGNEQTRIKPQGVDTSFLVATLTAAIQELNAKVEAQAAEIAALKK
jgi:hypothetical protein